MDEKRLKEIEQRLKAANDSRALPGWDSTTEEAGRPIYTAALLDVSLELIAEVRRLRGEVTRWETATGGGQNLPRPLTLTTTEAVGGDVRTVSVVDQAQAAAMRAALEHPYRGEVCMNLGRRMLFPESSTAPREDCGKCGYCLRKAVLSGDAGRDLLAQLAAKDAALRRVMEDGEHTWDLGGRHCATHQSQAGKCNCPLSEVNAALSSDAGREFEARIRAEERERCAKVADGFHSSEHIAEKIRGLK